MNNICFDNDLYLKIQKEKILERINQFNNKLYLEIGGKLFDDYHASRVLPGFKSDAKINMLKELKDIIEIIVVVNCNDIDSNKVRNDTGITYDQEVLRLIDAYNDSGFIVSSVALSFYHESVLVNTLSNKLIKNNIKVYKQYEVKGYPNDIKMVLSDEGLGKNEYINTTKPLVVVTAPGPGSGKLACCLSQLYLDSKNNIKSGYAKFETFPIWNLPLDHPLNVAYESATVDINDYNMIDPYHYKEYGKEVVNYNRDIESFPLLKDIFNGIYGYSPYKSPTDMGVNMIGFAITNENNAIQASKSEIIRRYYQTLKNNFLGKYSDEALSKSLRLLKRLDISINDRKCVNACIDKAIKEKVPVVCLEVDDKLITGKESKLLCASSAALLNALKYKANIDDNIDLISPTFLKPIEELKIGNLKHHNTKLHSEEVLLILSIQSLTDEYSKKALDALNKLTNIEGHSSVILPYVDLHLFNKLHINITEEPKTEAKRLYVK